MKKKKIDIDEDGFMEIRQTNSKILRSISDAAYSVSYPAFIRAVHNIENDKKIRYALNVGIFILFSKLTKWQTSYAMTMEGFPQGVVLGIDKEDYEAHKKKPDINIFLEEIDKEEEL